MYIKVKVKPSSKKEIIEKVFGKTSEYYNISVREPAERNLANNRICEIISDIYKVNRKLVKIISGHQSPSKILSINIPEKNV